MNTSVLQGLRAMLVGCALAAVSGPGCALPDQPADPEQDQTVLAKSEGTASASEPQPNLEDDEVCRGAPNTTACGRHIGFGGNRDTLYTCQDGRLLGAERCPSTCQHRPWGLSDICL